MEGNRLTNILNVSNQANLANCRRTNLFQYNLIVILGAGWLDRNQFRKEEEVTPVTVQVNQEGEVTVKGLNLAGIEDERKIKIYSDKKVVTSKDEDK